MSYIESFKEGPRELRRSPIRTGLNALTIMFSLAGVTSALTGCETTATRHEAHAEGMTAEEILAMQTSLKKLGYYRGALDGISGSGTKRAIVHFQKNHSLTPDGIYGEATRALVAEDLKRKHKI